MSVRCGARSGFALPAALMLLILGSIGVAGLLQRTVAQRAAVQRQINQVRRTHSAYGGQAVLLHWMRSVRGNTELNLADFADRPGRKPEKVAQRFVIQAKDRGEVKIALWIQDGQGMPLADTPDKMKKQEEYYDGILRRLGSNAETWTRPRGPMEISVNGAPKEVLDVLLKDPNRSADFRKRILNIRKDRAVIRSDVTQALGRVSAPSDERGVVMSVLVYEATLWRITMEMTDAAGTRWYEGMLEFPPGQSRPLLRSWRRMVEDVSGETFQNGRKKAGARRV